MVADARTVGPLCDCPRTNEEPKVRRLNVLLPGLSQGGGIGLEELLALRLGFKGTSQHCSKRAWCVPIKSGNETKGPLKPCAPPHPWCSCDKGVLAPRGM